MPYKDPEQQRKARREYYERNKEALNVKYQRYKDEARAKVRALKEVPCADCGVEYPYYVMDFDHVRGEKLGDISNFISNRQYQKAYDEIDKCEVVCSNCHRIRSWTRMQLNS